MNRFVGTWRLISFEEDLPDGHLSYPYGRNPVGLLIYDSSGNMAVQIMKPDRPALSSTESTGMSDGRLKESIEGFTAFWGTYEIDEVQGIITHYVKGHLWASSIGKELKREYEFSGKQLILKPGSTRRIVWERIS